MPPLVMVQHVKGGLFMTIFSMQLGGFLVEHLLQAQALVVVTPLVQAPLANTPSLGTF